MTKISSIQDDKNFLQGVPTTPLLSLLVGTSGRYEEKRGTNGKTNE
jgi:hypothetical protein